MWIANFFSRKINKIFNNAGTYSVFESDFPDPQHV